MGGDDRPFWQRKSLKEMTDSEWESLCDGCGRCCLVKLEDADDSSRTYFTDVGSTKYQRRQPATWKRSMNTVKRS